MVTKTIYAELEEKIKVLRETVWWDRELRWHEVEKWLEQFETSTNVDDDERLQCLFLLSNFMYFGRREIRELLRSVYRDLYKYPKVENIRKKNGNTRDLAIIEKEFKASLNKSRFLGMGNPSESGTHLLYFFRQENELSKESFIHGHEIFSRDAQGKFVLRDNTITEYVFLDDLCCSGSQAISYSRDLVKPIKDLNPNIKVSYFVLFGTDYGLEAIRQQKSFDEVECVYELDATFKAFSDGSRYYAKEVSPISKDKAAIICKKYDARLMDANYNMGFAQSQLLLGFYHNTPDNTPPFFWFNGTYETDKQWYPIFRRYHKIYGS